MQYLLAANEVCEGYVFTPVILFTGGSTWAGTPPWQVHPHQVHSPGMVNPPRQVHPLAGIPPGRCTLLAGTPPWQVHPSPRQVHPPGAVHAGRYGQQAGGTHPTWMQSCVKKYYILVHVRYQKVQMSPHCQVFIINQQIGCKNQWVVLHTCKAKKLSHIRPFTCGLHSLILDFLKLVRIELSSFRLYFS